MAFASEDIVDLEPVSDFFSCFLRRLLKKSAANSVSALSMPFLGDDIVEFQQKHDFFSCLLRRCVQVSIVRGIAV
jgi:hypothetical protein